MSQTSVSRILSWSIAVAALLGHCLAEAAAEAPVDGDIVLIGGTLHLGDGSEGVTGDVAIRDDRIVAVGKFELGQFKQRVNCKGLIVSPGFIDLHNHSDKPVLRKTTRAVVNYLTQGCTTIVTGNCGSGHVDVGAFYTELDEKGIGLNIAHLLPQGALRQEVMNTQRRPATQKELQQMLELTAKAMDDGAWGMSSGLIYVPSSYADTAELTELAKVVGQRGGVYCSHIRGEGSSLLKAVDEAMTIGREGALPVHISHFKSSGKNSWGLVRVAIDVINKRRDAGQIITADQYPYVASSTSLSATFLPPWAREGGSKAMLKRLEGGEDQGRIYAAIEKKLTSTDAGQRIQIARYRKHPEWAGRRVKEIADAEGMTPFDLVLQILKSGGASIVNFSINEDDVRYVMQQPWVATASDGSSRIPSEEMPHPRSYGTFPRKIGYYCVRENVVSLPHAIRSSTGLPADILGMSDRGYLRSGYAADIAIWDSEQMIDTATFDAPHGYSKGIRYLFVNGTAAIWDGDLTGALAGRALRHSAETH